MSVHHNLYVQNELFANLIDGTTLTTADWAFLGTVDQNMAKADTVEFAAVVYPNGGNSTTIQSGATSTYTLTLPINAGSLNQVLTTNGAGVLSWSTATTFDQSLNTSNNVQFVDLTLTGDLTVSGTTTLLETTNTEIKDNIILLNNGEAGAGVGGGTGTAGLEIERGSLTNVQLLFDETTDKWTLGTSGAIGTTRFIVAEIADASQTQGAIPGYDAGGKLAEAEGLAAAEVTQLQNIGATTISATQWGYIGNLDQDLITTSNVTFNDLSITGDISLSAGAGVAESVSAVLVADPAPVADGITLFDATAANRTATLPDNAALSGRTFTIVLVAKSGGNTLTINRAGTDTIEGGLTSMVLNQADQHIKFKSLGTGDWIIV